MDKKYQPEKTEKRIYSFWEKGKYFIPRINPKKKPFVITLPPPNVTGELHLGTAMCVTEDVMARFHRMLGETTLFLPGFDHASIAVEYLVGKQIKKQGLSKQKIGQEVFLKKAKKYADNSRNYIRQQLKLLGFSLDWTREAYTMDKDRTKAVKKAFDQLYKKGLIYQGEYIVNWCPSCQSAISDLENVHQEEEGQLYYLKYGPFTLATTRPETKFGDTAVAVHPDDKRYQKLIGTKFTYQSLIGPRQMKVVADKAVDPKFGTGAVKVTPGHDPSDFEIGQRHNLKIIKVINEKGEMTKAAGKFAGLPVLEARKKVVEELEKKKEIIKIEKITHAVGHCQRCERITEPLVSKQWFIKTKPLADKALKAVKNGQIQIIPQRFEKIYFNWLENIRDWCISRQLWWGHKIPIKGENDILDTWFSSSLWPISTLGWPHLTKVSRGKPEKPSDFEYFYPTTVRETGYDIIFFWVAKEIMMCLEMTGQVPFKTVLLHGMVRDKFGKKMSRSKGNVLDPVPLIEKYGTDALRMALIVGNAPGNDPSLGEEKIKAYRNFANKLWNIGRFIQMSSENKAEKIPPFTRQMNSKLAKDDLKVIKDLNNLIKETTNLIEKYRFDLAANNLYHFVWHRLADEYIEYSKDKIKSNPSTLSVLNHVYLTCIKLLHPFMPFITEEIWGIFTKDSKSKKTKNALIISSWPKV
ncbi:valine--tRNA ligase [Patescibacteria group bacterium]